MDQPPIMTAPTSTGSKTQWAKPQDWDKYRNTITALFMCHSLPVVMRVMREEHQFHATPKMFQTQIYQKWGLRKTKPGEARKEAKERKRQREESEDNESNASSSRSRGGAAAGEAPSVSGRSLESISPPTATPPTATPWPANVEDPPVATTTYDQQPPAPADGDVHFPAVDQDEYHSIATALEAQGSVPPTWKDFIVIGQAPLLRPGNDYKSHPSIPVGSQADSDPAYSAEGTNPHEYASGSWISTVLSSPPSSLAESLLRTAPSEKSYSSRSSRPSRRLGGRRFGGPSLHDDNSTQNSNAKRSRTMTPAKVSAGSLRHLAAPDALMVPEKSMFYARHFISTTFSTGIWALSQSSDTGLFDTECGKLERWFNDFNPAFDCLKEQRVKRAFRLLKRCFANTKIIIEPQDPRVVIYVAQQAIRAMFYDTLGRNLSQTLLKYISGLCQVLFGVHHPLYIILNGLSRMGSFEFAQSIRPFMDCYFEHLEPFLEQSSNAFGHITEMRGLTVSLMEATGMIGVYEAKPVLDGLVRKAESFGLPTLHLRVETAAILQRNRFFNEALDILSEVRVSKEAESHPYEFHYAGIVLILTLRKMKDRDGAIRAGYELADFLSTPPERLRGFPERLSLSWRQYLESRESSLLLILGKLEQDLREAGRMEEADQVQARLERSVATEFGVDEVDEDPEAEVNAMV